MKLSVWSYTIYISDARGSLAIAVLAAAAFASLFKLIYSMNFESKFSAPKKAESRLNFGILYYPDDY